MWSSALASCGRSSYTAFDRGQRLDHGLKEGLAGAIFDIKLAQQELTTLPENKGKLACSKQLGWLWMATL
jgi:hypothetical protein